MSFQLPNTRPVTSSEQVSFHCKRCGACCRHVQESVPLNTMDAYRLAKYLRSRGEHIDCLDTVFARYTEPTPDGGCKYLLSMEQSNHFKGGQIEAGRWMKKFFTPEDGEFMRIDIGSAPVIALLMGKIPESGQNMLLPYIFHDPAAQKGLQ